MSDAIPFGIKFTLPRVARQLFANFVITRVLWGLMIVVATACAAVGAIENANPDKYSTLIWLLIGLDLLPEHQIEVHGVAATACFGILRLTYIFGFGALVAIVADAVSKAMRDAEGPRPIGDGSVSHD